MNYELFKEIVEEKFLDYMPDAFKDCRVEIQPVEKTNRTMDGLTLVPADSERCISPTMYIDHMYEHYQDLGDLERVLEQTASNMAEAFRDMPERAEMLSLENAKDNIIMVLVNTEQNKEMLADVPHREFQDLSIVYRWVVEKGREGIASSIVNHSLAEKLGMDEAALYQAAVVNTKELLPPVVKSMEEVICEMFMGDGMPAEIADMMTEEMSSEKAMYIISNELGMNGAASMLYETELHKLAERLDTDLYIMPSSIHEVIAISAEMGDPNEIAEMVADINMSQVPLEDRLSNQVYHYDKDLRKLNLATDTPNKRLDGMVSEAGLVYEAKQAR